MASQTRFPATAADLGDWSAAWAGVGNITADDSDYATAGPERDGQSVNNLRASNFGFTIPSGATIDGIIVSIEASNPDAPDGRTDVAEVNIVKGGAAGAENRAADAATLLTVDDVVYVYGSAAQLWGEAWTTADINAAGFGAQVRYLLDGNADLIFTSVAVDYISITVHFTDNSPVEVFTEDGGAGGDAIETLSVVAMFTVADAWGASGRETATVRVISTGRAEPARPAALDYYGRCLRLPIAADARGTLAVLSSREEIVEQSIRSIVETRQGERVMLPDYGLPDFVFSVMDAGFAARVAYFIEEQVRRYEPLVEEVCAQAGTIRDGRFESALALADTHRAAVRVVYKVRGGSAPRNLVFPTWELAASAAGAV